MDGTFSDDWSSGDTEEWDESWLGECTENILDICQDVSVTILKDPDVSDSLVVEEIVVELDVPGPDIKLTFSDYRLRADQQNDTRSNFWNC